jgi:hypothetical protein
MHIGMDADITRRRVARSRGLAVSLALVLAGSILATVGMAEPSHAAGDVAPSIEQCFLELHNGERTSRGLHPLVVDATLRDFARAWSFEMEASGDFRHSDLSWGGHWYGRGENIGWHQGYGENCTFLHNSFMDSSGHRANILRASFDMVGIGVVYDPVRGGILHVTVTFGDSDGTTGPSPNQSLGNPPEVDLPPSVCASACDGFAIVDGGGQWFVYPEVGPTDPTSFFFGNPGDVPFMGDWDGDGVATPGLYRQSDGFVYVRFSNSQGVADREFFFGDPGDVPLVGDFDGDGRDSVSIWRASEARVYVINELGGAGKGLGAAEFSFAFGNPGDAPFVGDFDGDGVDSVGLYRESTGFVYFRDSLSSGVADVSFFFGDPGDRIVAGDWDGDGRDSVGVYRASTGRFYVSLENAAGPADWHGYVGSFPYLVTAGNT